MVQIETTKCKLQTIYFNHITSAIEIEITKAQSYNPKCWFRITGGQQTWDILDV